MARKTPRSIWFLLIGLLAFVAVGCGGDDSSDESSSEEEEAAEPLSEDEFLEQFEEACSAIDDELEDLPDPESYEDIIELAPQASEIATEGIETLQDIVPPEDLADDVDELLGLLEDRLELNEDLVTAAEDEDDEAIQEIVDEGEDLDDEIDAIAEDIGLECFVDEEDLTSDFSDDFSDGDIGVGVAPQDAIPEYGTDPELDALADACYAGDYGACDDLYAQAAAGSGYEAYGDTCAGLQELGTGQFCAEVFG